MTQTGNETWMGEVFYSVGLTEYEMTLLIRCIDEEEFSATEENELKGVRKKIAHRRKLLRQREGIKNEAS